MNSRMLRVNLIPVEDCFAHLSSKLIRELNSKGSPFNYPVCLKVTTIDSKPEEFYLSYSQTPYNSNGNDAFNISHELSSSICLSKSQDVLITSINYVNSLDRIYVTPVTNDDWELLTLNNVSLQYEILQQLKIVHKNKIIPIWVSKFVHLRILIDDLGDDNLQVGLLNETTEIVVQPYVIASTIDSHNNNINIDQDLDNNCVNIDSVINYNDIYPVSSFSNRFIYRTILVNEMLLQTEHIYDYCALISKSHFSIIYKNDDSYSNGINFVKLSPLYKFVDLNAKDSNNQPKVYYHTAVIRLCPLDPFMNNVEKFESISLPTIYITKTLSNLLGLKMNAKVVLEPVSQTDNEICNVECIFISPLKEMKNLEKNSLITCLEKKLKDEIAIREVLVLNNFCHLHVVANKLSSFMDVSVAFSSTAKIRYIFLNEYNIGMLKFIWKTEDKQLVPFNIVGSDEETELKNINENIMFNTFQSHYYDLNCFRKIIKSGSLCLKNGLQIYAPLQQTFFEFDNLLITGSIATGKTTVAKLLCHKLSKCPYFVKIIWINGRLLAGKLWETVVKQLTNQFEECLYYQPAVIVIDDFDDLCHLNSEPNKYVDMSHIYLRSLHLLMRLIEDYTHNQYCIKVICTAKTMNQDKQNLFKQEFKNVFKTVISIPSIDKENRKAIISKRLYNIVFDNDTDELLNSICEKMDNYVIQDLLDFCDKILFDILKGGCKTLSKTVINNVFEKTVPLSLHNVKLIKEKKINFSLVGGLKNAKQTITEIIIWPSLYSDIFSKCPLKLQSGVLLYGAPGTGKTLLAKAIVGESDLNFISVNGPELLSKYVGESEENVRKIFQRAQNAKPCIIFFDEFESIVPKRGSEETGVTDRVVNQFLTQLDGIDTFEGVWVIAATSRPDLIDTALLRPGRIGIKLHCPMPNTEERLDILRVLSKTVTLSEDIDLNNIAAETINYTGADLYGLLYSAHSIAEKKSLKEENDIFSSDCQLQPIITMDDFQDALITTVPSLNQTDVDRYERIHQIFSGKKNNNNTNVKGIIPQKTIFM